MAQVDYGLLNTGVKINTPFENLGTILQVRNQQQAGHALAEQRRASADKSRQEAEAARFEAEAAAEVAALFKRVDPVTGQPKPPTVEELAGTKIGPDAATKIFTGFETLKKAQWANQDEARSDVASVLNAVMAFPTDDLRAKAYSGARSQLIAQGKLTPQDAPENYSADFVKSALTAALSPEKIADLNKPPADYTLGDQRMSGATNTPLATARPKAAELGSLEDFLVSYATQRRLKPEQLSARDKLNAKAQYEAAGRAPAGAGSKIWVNRGGELIRIGENEYQRGDTPANAREQGRPVTSGDAGRIADLDTSLDDLAVLANTLGTTGAGSKVGAMLPNVVSEVTGWGADSKARQGTIDRVKQVIGKALEGGVLRKEDEIKYEKILPTIGDPPSVAKAKLEGLQKALVLRRQTMLDALADAGYETSKFAERTGQRSAAPSGDDSAASSLLAGKPDGVYTLSDGSKWTVRGGKVSR
jgi:hypothetical protein